MIAITQAQILGLAPKAIQVYRDAFAAADAELAPFGINNTALRLSHFLAQVLHESGALMLVKENLNYSVEGLMKTWPKRFPTVEIAQQYARNPEKIANFVYGGRMGNVDPGDGWKYIGRGLIQITGRDNYRKFGGLLGVDLQANPDLVAGADWVLKVAAAFWQDKQCNALADADDIVGITKKINGGLVGLDDRKAWLAKCKAIWH
jgi:putative chitinase